MHFPRHDTEQPRQSVVDGGWCQVAGHDVVAVAEHVGIGRRGRLGEEPAERLLP